jgi:hypothetical protein
MVMCGHFDVWAQNPYMRSMMRTVLSGLALSTALLALPAAACDMHGVNGMHWTPMSQWQNFSPRQSFIDPAFANDDEMRQDTVPTTVPPARPRPTFANAANKAALSAKSKLGLKLAPKTETAKVEETVEEEWKPKLIVRQTSLESHTQPVR